MSTQPLSARLRRMSARQRKKLHVGEFQELAFEMELQFKQALDAIAYTPLLDDLIRWADSRNLALGGLGGEMPLTTTYGLVAAWGRGSPSEDDRQAMQTWLQARPEIASVDVGPLVDAWHT